MRCGDCGATTEPLGFTFNGASCMDAAACKKRQRCKHRNTYQFHGKVICNRCKQEVK